MSMNLNSPVKILPQEVMSSTIGSAEYKREAEPDALDAPCAKKRVISDATPGLPMEDKTPPLEVSSECSTNDKVLEELYCPESDEQSDMSDFKVEIVGQHFINGPNEVDKILHFTTDLGDFEALRKALARMHSPESELYKKRYERVAAEQFFHELTCREKMKNIGQGDRPVKLHVQAVFFKNGSVITGAAHWTKI